MAVWKELQVKELPSFRLDAEYYQPTNLELEAQLLALNPCRLGDYAFVTDGIHASPVVVETGGVRYLSAKSVKDNRIITENAIQISNEQDAANKKTRIQAGDVLLTTVGTIGNAAVVTDVILPANMDRHLGLIRLHIDCKIDPYYLSTFLNCLYGRFQTIREATGNVQLNLFIEKIKELLVPELPCMAEVSLKTREAYTKRQESLHLYFQTEQTLLLQLGLLNFDISPEQCYEKTLHELIGANRYDAEYYQPAVIRLLSHIKSCPHFLLKDIASVSSGHPWVSKYFLDDDVEGEPFIRIRDCKPGLITIDDLSRLECKYANAEKVSKGKQGDIVIGMDGVRYFYGSILPDDCYVNQRVSIVSCDSIDIMPEYVLLVINSIVGQSQLLREMTIAHTVGHITNDNIRNLIIPTLDINEISKLTYQVKQSFTYMAESKVLLEKAKRLIEDAINLLT